MDILENVSNLLNWGYLLALILLVWVILTYIILNTTRIIRILVHLVCGTLLGWIWLYFVKTITIDQLIVNFLLSIMIYSWVVKALMEKFDSKYNNDKGVI